MVKIGIVGIGFMGMIHYLAAKRLAEAKVAAVSSRDPRKLAGDWTMIQGNFGPRGGHEDLTGVRAYQDAADLLADPEIQLVDICLPNDRHAEWAIRALEAGKHVLVEKAIALTLADADRMLSAAQRSGRLLMVAHVLPFFPDFAYALEAIRSGRYGRLVAAHFRRHISPPDWSAAMKDFQTTGGGPIVDLHIHDTHFVNLACGVPAQVSSRGVFRDQAIEYIATHYLYAEGTPVITATSGAISQGSRPFTHGYEIYFEKGTLYYEAGGPLVVYGSDGQSQPPLPSADPIDSFGAEILAAVRAVSASQPADLLDARLARNALALCLKEEESARTGRAVAV